MVTTLTPDRQVTAVSDPAGLGDNLAPHRLCLLSLTDPNLDCFVFDSLRALGSDYCL